MTKNLMNLSLIHISVYVFLENANAHNYQI